MKGIPWTTENFKKAEVESSDANLRALGLLGKDLALLWLENCRHTWWNIAQNNPIPPVKGATITVKDVYTGRYRVEFFDIWKGGVISKTWLRVKNDEIRIAVPKIDRDIAVKLSREGNR